MSDSWKLCELAALSQSSCDVHIAVLPVHQSSCDFQVAVLPVPPQNCDLEIAATFPNSCVGRRYPQDSAPPVAPTGEAAFSRTLSKQVLQLLCLIFFILSTSASALTYEELPPQWPQEHGEAALCPWPDGKNSALSITIDDNNAPDIPFWQEMAATTGWRFTWFLIVHPMMWNIETETTGSNTSYFGTPEAFRPLLEAGHEIELHGSCKEMNHLTPEDYETHLLKSKAYLENALDHRITTYAYPCGELGPEKGDRSYYEIIKKHFLAARGTQGGPTPIHLIDFHNTRSMGAVGMKNPESDQRRFDSLANPDRPPKYSYYRGWGVLLYHGLGSDEKKQQVRTALERLKSDEHKYWIAPFGEVARYSLQRSASTVETLEATPDRIQIRLTDSLPDAFPRLPLTVKVRIVDANSATLSGETDAPIEFITHQDATYAQFAIRPGHAELILNQ